MLVYRSPVPLSKFQMAPIFKFVTSSRSKKKEPRYACLNEAKASHSHSMWIEVSFSVPQIKFATSSGSKKRNPDTQVKKKDP
jgi:dsRNA-specific ribonuclease